MYRIHGSSIHAKIQIQLSVDLKQIFGLKMSILKGNYDFLKFPQLTQFVILLGKNGKSQK